MEQTTDGPQVDELMDTHGPRVLGLLSRLVGNSEDARDVYQETWTSIWRALDRLRPGVDPWPFIRRSAVHKAIDHIRIRRLETTDRDDVAAPSPRSDTVDLNALPDRERVSLLLFFYGGCSVREIAEHLEVPPGTIKTWMHRGRKRLREQLLEQPDGGMS